MFVCLDEATIAEMLAALGRPFPEHSLVCGPMNRRFFEENGRSLREKTGGVGAAFRFAADEPEALFAASGYRRAEKIPIIGRAVDYGPLDIPKAHLETALVTLAEGNAVYVFERDGDEGAPPNHSR